METTKPKKYDVSKIHHQTGWNQTFEYILQWAFTKFCTRILDEKFKRTIEKDDFNHLRTEHPSQHKSTLN